MAAKTITVAEHLSKAIELSGLTQREVAEAVGYPKPNVISMMKLGQTKIPIEKIPAFAKALGVDPGQFLRIALREYTPQVWAVIQAALGDPLTEREKVLVEALREVDPAGEITLDSARLTQIKEVLVVANVG